jgi:hypothetical protein
MSFELRCEIFKELADQVNWEKHLEYIRRNPEFKQEKRTNLINIYNFLKKELGKDYLGRCYRDGNNTLNHWLCGGGYQESQLNWVTESLKHFKQQNCNYQTGLLGRLRSNEEANRQGFPFLIAGDSLRKAGFEVMFEPEVNFNKKPDLKITIPEINEIIYGEVSQLNESKVREQAGYTYHSLFELFHFKTLVVNFAAKIHQIALKEDIVSITNIILEAKGNAHKNKAFIVVTREETGGIIEFGVAHNDKVHELEEWAKEKKYRGINELFSLSLDFNYTSRLRSKISDEAKQLPESHAGIIYVTLPATYFLFGVPSLFDMIDSLKEELAKFPHVIGICLCSHLGNVSEPVKEIFGFNYFERKMVHEDIQQDVLFVINNEFNIELENLANTLLKLYNSFGQVFI